MYLWSQIFSRVQTTAKLFFELGIYIHRKTLTQILNFCANPSSKNFPYPGQQFEFGRVLQKIWMIDCPVRIINKTHICRVKLATSWRSLTLRWKLSSPASRNPQNNIIENFIHKFGTFFIFVKRIYLKIGKATSF